MVQAIYKYLVFNALRQKNVMVLSGCHSEDMATTGDDLSDRIGIAGGGIFGGATYLHSHAVPHNAINSCHFRC